MNYTNPSKLQAAILDWAGTVVDFGSFAPTQIFVEAFAEFDVQVSIEEARGPMGMGKWDHIRTLCDQPQITERYTNVFGRAPTDEDVTAIYQRFMPLQIEKIAEHSALIPGALETIAKLREQGIKIGSCSGYPAQVMAKVVELAATNGYVADHVVATDEVPNGRPWPAQALANVIALGIDDVGACVKIDDTVPGILEGRRAGMWTVALVCSGNALGLTYAQYKALDAATLDSERTRIHALFAGSRPHYLIDTISDLPNVIADINQRLANGEMPQSS
ncbi:MULTISPECIES: phosphonoacetaldehyde hydrolase [Pseudomonas]|jgi:phosphonoacetaldehyde hydrolase|uniref:Phosphonoacetaldehyde hydrolase n=1 Tax=Pseudomonas psychrophila TaxID=122355 RepID=A0A8I1K6F7_9PSED|nr:MULTISPECIES: phosphonoacetaldehyde hydrolase [Pseudomonas]EPJ91791.1 phosphonoacetaldehyde hydrolase [Pseudomonas psychrophila]KAB0491001.1 phosphonoacetaldehyde hydrolase [Pseudomonas psychrophila]KMM99855.1 phosphonoacetaldehyde hydrolase [Pseudomonas psychrophila]MBJ2255526.1 phosphonoacetaldehyde hydrolase [Pseudomonas psychrophila]MDY7581598.1 phosphonoacetaldehyde hydrolase [Pseudomonas sp. CCI3.1]